MRLWHEALIPYLPRQQLLGQHRECCALRGKGWGKKHAIVNYVFDHPYEMLYQYHLKIMEEMHRRGYKTESLWQQLEYRGKNTEPHILESMKKEKKASMMNASKWIYPEHDSSYLQECLLNLERKGIELAPCWRRNIL